jgi:ankyrin repeat protein
VRALLDAGSDVNAQDGAGRTALMIAALVTEIPNLKALIQRGANPGMIDNQVQTSLDYAVERSEAAGLNLVIRGLAELLKDDRKLVAQSIPIFDGLYELLGRNQEKSKGGENGKKRSQNRAARRGRRAAGK